MISWLVAPAITLLLADALLLVRFAFPTASPVALRRREVPVARQRLVLALYAVAAACVALVALALLG